MKEIRNKRKKLLALIVTLVVSASLIVPFLVLHADDGNYGQTGYGHEVEQTEYISNDIYEAFDGLCVHYSCLDAEWKEFFSDFGNLIYRETIVLNTGYTVIAFDVHLGYLEKFMNELGIFYYSVDDFYHAMEPFKTKPPGFGGNPITGPSPPPWPCKGAATSTTVSAYHIIRLNPLPSTCVGINVVRTTTCLRCWTPRSETYHFPFGCGTSCVVLVGD